METHGPVHGQSYQILGNKGNDFKFQQTSEEKAAGCGWDFAVSETSAKSYTYKDFSITSGMKLG